MKALILAGGKGEAGIDGKGQNKAIVKICEKEMIFYVIDALKKLPYLEEIAVVGDMDVLELVKDSVDKKIEEGESFFDNILRGVEAFDDAQQLLILTSDIPMITKEALEEFIKKAQGQRVDFSYSIVAKEDCEKRFPGTKRTYVKIKDGIFTGGNIVMIKPSTLKETLPQVKEVLSYRKKPWKLARILGFTTVIKLLLGSLTISELENKVSKIFDIKARAVRCSHPEIATDVDKEEDLLLAKKILCQEEF